MSKCEHGKSKYLCKECSTCYFCTHGRRKYTCKDCIGSQICDHRRIKITCKECGGSQVCEHGKQKSTCKECGGSQICKHGKHKSTCKECGGSALCKSTWCETRGNCKYDNYCVYCYINLFPDQKISHNYKTKEKAVADNVKNIFKNFTWICDKKIQDGCSKRRPDLLLDIGSHILIVEIDENKHTNYDCICENKRLMEISKDLGFRPIVLIRFNPDSYINTKGRLVKSCWKTDKFGILKISKTKKDEWEERLNILNQQIQYWIDNYTEKTLEINELFY